jgi:hypothetical protein
MAPTVTAAAEPVDEVAIVLNRLGLIGAPAPAHR